MENFESLRREKRRRKALLKLFGLDVVPNYPDFNKEGLAIVISLRILYHVVACIYMYIDFDY